MTREKTEERKKEGRKKGIEHLEWTVSWKRLLMMKGKRMKMKMKRRARLAGKQTS